MDEEIAINNSYRNFLCYFQDGHIDYSEFVAMMQDTDFGKIGLKVN